MFLFHLLPLILVFFSLGSGAFAKPKLSCPKPYRALAKIKIKNPALWPLGADGLVQEFDSAATSINSQSLPRAILALQENGRFTEGGVNLDIGGGRFDNVAEYLQKKDVSNLVYDPFNRGAEHNSRVVNQVQNGGADTVTVNNVLNVIRERENWQGILEQAQNALRDNGVLHIQIYEGAKSWTKADREHVEKLVRAGRWNEALKYCNAGASKETAEGKSWQNNMPIEAYLPFVQKYFPDAHIESFRYTAKSGNKQTLPLIVARKVKSNEALIQEAKELGIEGRSKHYGVGKEMVSNVYLHKQYEQKIPQHVLQKAKKKLPKNFEYTVVKFNRLTNDISFIVSKDFDTAAEPTVGDSLKVSFDGEVTLTKAPEDPLIYHHKWAFVGDDYSGFDVAQSIRRSMQWKKVVGTDKEVSSKIGRKSFWEESILPKIKSENSDESATNKSTDASNLH